MLPDSGMTSWLSAVELRAGTTAVVLSMLALPATTSVARADSDVTQYVQRSWTDKEGLPGNQVWAIAQGLDGYIWLGTNAGLVRFDGVHFDVRVGEPNLPVSTVRVLCVSRDGSLWIGFGAGGISRLRDGVVTNYGFRDGIPTGTITGLVEDRDGTIWAASNAGASRFSNGHWRLLDGRSGLSNASVQALFVDRRGTLWAGTSSGIFRRTAGVDVFEWFSSARLVSAFSEDSSGALWITDLKYGFHSLDGRHVVAQAAHRQQAAGSRLHHDAVGNLWVGTLGQGLLRVTQGPDRTIVVDRLGVKDGLSNEIVWSVTTDREGSVWVGTQHGLNQLSVNVVMSLPVTSDTSMNTLIRGVDASSDGSVWVGTADGLYRFRGTARERFDRTQGLHSTSILSIHADKGRQLWVATTDGVSMFDRGRFSDLPLPQGASLSRVNAMTTDSQGALWLIDVDAGLLKWSAGKLIRVTVPSAIEKKTATAMLSGRQGQLWIGFSDGGLARYEKGEFRSYEPATGVEGGTILSLYEDADETLWIGANGGLHWSRANQFHAATRRNGLPGNFVSAITEDDEGRLWLGVNAGIVRLAKTELANIEADPNYQLKLTLFASADGVRGNPVALGSPKVARAADGSVWFPTTAGVAVVNPEKAEKRRISPPVKIEAVSLDDRRIDRRVDDTLSSRASRIQIDYTALSFVAPSTVRFRYRLEGYDKDWVDAENRRSAVYTRLPPGSYHFRVVASNDGVKNDIGDDWAFSVSPMFYQTRLFDIASVMVLVGLVGAGWHMRASRFRARLLVTVEERTRVAREIHDTLLQSLLGIAFEIDEAATEVGPEYDSTRARLRRLRNQIQTAIRETRQSIWDLRLPILLEKSDLATELKRNGEAIAAGKVSRFEFSVSGTPRRAPNIDEELFQLGQEAIRNVVRHAKATFVRVELTYGTESIVLRILDDGCGFDADNVGGAHWGLAMMEERARKIEAEFRVFSRPGAGTEIETIARA